MMVLAPAITQSTMQKIVKTDALAFGHFGSFGYWFAAQVGKKFKGHAGIRKYFEDYFIGYKTKTKLVKLEVITETRAHLTVEFTGEFPEGQLGGTFEFTFKNGKIKTAKADLL